MHKIKIRRHFQLSDFPLTVKSSRKSNILLELRRKCRRWRLPEQRGAATKNAEIQLPTELTVRRNRRGTTEEPPSEQGEMCSVTNRDHLTNAAFPGVGGRTGECQQSIIFKREINNPLSCCSHLTDDVDAFNAQG